MTSELRVIDQNYETYFARFGSSAAKIYDKLFINRQQIQVLRYFPVK